MMRVKSKSQVQKKRVRKKQSASRRAVIGKKKAQTPTQAGEDDYYDFHQMLKDE